MEKINELTSENIVQQNIERLKEIFPTAFSEGKLVVEELQALVGEYIQKDKEFYQMTWAGKTEAQREANKVSTGTLRPSKEESKDWDSTRNVFIEGDNLEVLKLLQKSYSSKIKMIYIDPPYNTGKDFVYKDNYKDNLNNYLELTRQTDEKGKKLSTNTESDGRYHSNWLNMMYPRLKLARNLLKDDGVIFISVDEIEYSNLVQTCNQVFGEENHVADFVWQNKKGGGNDSKYVAIEHEYILVYSKNIYTLREFYEFYKPEYLKRYKEEDEKGKFYWDTFKRKSGKQFYPIPCPDGSTLEYDENGEKISWLRSEATFKENVKDGEIKFAFNNGKYNVYFKQRLPKGKKPRSIFNDLILNQNGTTSSGSERILKLFDTNLFSNPKPIQLINKLFFNVDSEDIILDFFAGSGSTADAMLNYNYDSQQNLKFILVQLDENISLENSKGDADKITINNAIKFLSESRKELKITEITKERIRRAGDLIKKDNKDKEGIEKLDTGFRVFKLDSSNMKPWDTSLEKFEGQLDIFAENNGDHIKPNRTEEDVLFEILLKYGLELTLTIAEKVVGECKIYNIGFGSMYICLSDQIKIDVATTIGEWHKESSDTNPSVIFKDSGFDNDADKTNTVQTLRQAGIENVKSI